MRGVKAGHNESVLTESPIVKGSRISKFFSKALFLFLLHVRSN